MKLLRRFRHRRPADFSVRFGKYARTIEYEGGEAQIVFTFDINGARSITLEHHSPTTLRTAIWRRIRAREAVSREAGHRGSGVRQLACTGLTNRWSQPPKQSKK
jgi:hypothetical protein